MKEFYGDISLILDLSFSIKANSKEEAIEKIFEKAYISFNVKDEETEEDIFTDVDVNNWYFVDKPAQGNVRQSGIRTFEIFEEGVE